MNQFSGSEFFSTPDPDEIEVSIFGPGYGESILVHLGGYRWLIVDSCLDSQTREPAPLAYLQKIHMDASTCVQQVIATHWHDDHIRGLSKILETCQSSKLVLSSSLKSEDFCKLIGALTSKSKMQSSGVDEFSKILPMFKNRPIQLAVANRCLWRNSHQVGAETIPISVHSLSPSDQAIVRSYQAIAALIPQEKDPVKRVQDQPPNHGAVVIWIEIGPIKILLGSDLEETGNENTGWSAIIGSSERPAGQAEVFKIPHHGSQTGHHLQIWTELVAHVHLSGVTPFGRGKVTLPSQSDIDRILGHSRMSYITASSRHRSPRKRSPMVEKSMKEVVRSIKVVELSTGQVRFRKKISATSTNWTVDLWGTASDLAKLGTRADA